MTTEKKKMYNKMLQLFPQAIHIEQQDNLLFLTNMKGERCIINSLNSDITIGWLEMETYKKVSDLLLLTNKIGEKSFLNPENGNLSKWMIFKSYKVKPYSIELESSYDTIASLNRNSMEVSAWQFK